ncbi:MAG: glycosyl transferase, partial [Clostridiales bacterium]|nr:glycosyl transferase [Clostridiales bacterium]
MVKQDDLYAQARHLAEKYGPTKYSKLKKAGFPSIEGDARDLFLAYKKVDEQVKAKQNIIPAAEWILDNFYMLEEQSKHIQLERLDNFGELPTLEGGKLRIYALAEDFVSFTDGKLGEEEIISFLEGYQSITPLDSGELWIFPMAIKIALIRKTREVAVHIVKLQEQKKDGQRWGTLFVDSIDAPKGEMHKLIVNHDSQIDYMPASYVEGMLLVFRNSGEKSAHLMTWLDGKLALQGTNAEEMIQLEHQKQAGYQVSIGNCITSLRFLLSIRWEEIFEELSLLEEILNNDPAKFYSEMEFVSRDYYRNELIKIARKYKVSEFEVAEAAIRCAEEGISSSGKDIKKGHIGYYLIGRGRGKLRAYLGDDPGGNGWINENPGVFYFGSIGLIVLTTLGFMMGFLYKLDTGQNIFKVILSGLVLLVPVITLAVGFMHKIIPRVVRPYYLPKLELSHGIPEEYRTMVVIPTLLTEEKRVWELAEQMEVFYLANQEDNIHFALISDFKDSKNEEEPGDGAIIEAATRAVNELNNRYGRNGESIFYFFHRHRKWDPKQMSWMGWERKRGALVEFTSMLRGDEDTSFSTKIGDLSILPKIKYVITLDADTNLPRDAAKRLIGTLAHPLNRPVIDSSRGFVTEGYGLLQPRIGVSVDSASRSSFALTFSGQTGVDPYTTAVSDVYQDLFSEGIFTGKGIYDADVFNMVLKEAIPENRVLSHDLLEGSYIRAGLVTDIELIDGYPANYISYAMRLHRWVRGDWQLLPWLFPKVYNRKGIKVKNPLRPISKWKIFDNLRRSLVYPSLFLMLALGLTVLPRSDWFWLGLFAITLTLPLIMDVAGSFIAQMGSSHGQSLGDVLYGTKHLAMQII